MGYFDEQKPAVRGYCNFDPGGTHVIGISLWTGTNIQFFVSELQQRRRQHECKSDTVVYTSA